MKKQILFKNDLLIQAKLHLMPIIYAITLSIFLAVVLILLNYVNGSVNLGQGILYDRVILFYNIMLLSLIISIYILSPIFNAGSITNIYNNNKLINLIVAGINIKDILFEKIVIGIMNLSFTIIAILPVAYVSLFYGGLNTIKIVKIILMLLFLIIMNTCLDIMISSYNNNLLLSYLICYLASLFIIIPTILIVRIIINNNIYLLLYSIVSIILSIVFYLVSLKGNSFKF